MKPLALVAALAFAASAQDSAPTFRATTDLVLLDVTAVHRKTGNPAPSLERAQLRVSEDGVPQDIAFFSRDELPLSVVLLFDLTESVQPVLKRLAGGAKSALLHLKPEDEVAVMNYAAAAKIVDSFTTDRTRTVVAIERAAAEKSDEAAFFNEAVYQAATLLASSANPASRRVIIWLTDNIPNVPSDRMRAEHGRSITGPLHTEIEAVRAAHEAGVSIAPILLASHLAPLYRLMAIAESSGKTKFPPGDAHTYAEVTGGESMPLKGKAVDARLADLIDALRSRYTIGYRPAAEKPAGTFCRVKIELDPKGPLRPKEWLVRAREGYYRK
jgi:VWFA-related protein